MLARAVGRSATVVKVLTGENFTLTLDLKRLSSLICDLSVSYQTFDLHLFLYFPMHTCTCNLYFLSACYQQLGKKNHNHGEIPGRFKTSWRSLLLVSYV